MIGRLLFIKLVFGGYSRSSVKVTCTQWGKTVVYTLFGKTRGNGVFTLRYEHHIHALYAAGIRASSLNFGKLLMHHGAIDIGCGGNAGIERDIRSVRDATSQKRVWKGG